jgi:hypothetical protein
MKKLEVNFDQRQVAAFGYTTCVNAYIDYLNDDIFDALGTRKEQYGAFLDGVSGDIFRFFYSRQDRMGATFVYPRNPLKTFARALAYKHEYTYNSSEDEMIKIKKHIEDGRPVLMPLVIPPPDWALITGYDELKFYLYTFSGPKEMTRDQFIDATGKPWWQPTLDIEKPRGSRPMFVLLERILRADMQKIIIDGIKLGIEMATTAEIAYDGKKYTGGIAAFLDRAADLEAERDYKDFQDKSLVSWHFFPLLYLQLSRWSRTSFLTVAAKHFTGADQSRLENTQRYTDDINRYIREYREALAVPWPKSPPNSEEIILTKIKDPERRARGAQLLRQLADAEKATVDELQKLVG